MFLSIAHGNVTRQPPWKRREPAAALLDQLKNPDRGYEANGTGSGQGDDLDKRSRVHVSLTIPVSSGSSGGGGPPSGSSRIRTPSAPSASPSASVGTVTSTFVTPGSMSTLKKVPASDSGRDGDGSMNSVSTAQSAGTSVVDSSGPEAGGRKVRNGKMNTETGDESVSRHESVPPSVTSSSSGITVTVGTGSSSWTRISPL